MSRFKYLYKIKSIPLNQENSIFNSVIKKCDTIKLDGFNLILKKTNSSNIFIIDLSDIFLYNHIKFPDKNDKNLIYYQTETCENLTPLIKFLSWKNNTLVISDPNIICIMLREIKIKMEKNPNAIYFYENNENQTNICSFIFGIKYQQHQYERLFFIYNNTIFYCNINNVVEYPFNNKIYESLNKILNCFENNNEK